MEVYVYLALYAHSEAIMAASRAWPSMRTAKRIQPFLARASSLVRWRSSGKTRPQWSFALGAAMVFREPCSKGSLASIPASGSSP